MSGRLSGEVWKSNLPSKLKSLAATLADFANDHGENIFPSVERIAWRLSMSKRSVQYRLKELKALGVLQVVENARGGRGLPVKYRMIESNLPVRTPWCSEQKGENPASFTSQKGATQDGKGRNPRPKSVQAPAYDPSGARIEPSGAALHQPSQDARSKTSLTVGNPERQITVELAELTKNKSCSDTSRPFDPLMAELYDGIYRKKIDDVFLDSRRQPFPEQLKACVEEATTSLMLNRVGKMMHLDETELIDLALRKLHFGAVTLESVRDFSQRRRQVTTSVTRCVIEAAVELLSARGQSACA